ncbi:MAG TPA: zinc-dependent alcohol dehydrogenase family protein [Steroidobacteraceae bacterium]|nr:zinc-dependent alcohol dehydrogenase family protein [Steroidobacteraceae bacterium]
MLAMVLNRPRHPLEPEQREIPRPGPGEVLLRVRACAVCRTDLHVIDDELPAIRHPIVPGHEIVGEVAACGDGVAFHTGERLGVPWLGSTCGHCEFCRAGQENLCDQARFTGYQIDGGYADYVVADARFCLRLPDALDDAHAAPLLCAGLIGYRSLRMTGDARRIGLYGFGAAAHIVAQVARFQGRECYAFVRAGDTAAAAFAIELGCVWAGSSEERPPVLLDAAIVFAPLGALVPRALAALRKGGTVVCGGIHMSDIPTFPYSLLWGERIVRSVANLTRRDGQEFLALAPQVPIRTHVTTFPLYAANEALEDLRAGRLSGAAVLLPER